MTPLQTKRKHRIDCYGNNTSYSTRKTCVKPTDPAETSQMMKVGNILRRTTRDVKRVGVARCLASVFSVDLLSVDALTLEHSLRVGVSEAVLVPQGAGGLHKLSLSRALLISKEA